MQTVAKTLIEQYNVATNIKVTGNYRLGDIRHNYADLSKIKRLLNFTPKWKFADGISEFTKWVNKQSIKEDKYEESIIEMKNKGLYK